MNVTIIDYGRSNLLSVCRAFEACGARVSVASTPEEAARARALVLPGVGAIGDGMQALRFLGLDEVLGEKARTGTPLLGICLGMQMLLDASDEGGLHQGLGLVPGRVERIPAADVIGNPQPVPNIGWAPLLPTGGRADFADTPFAGIRPRDECYFVHGYEAKPASPEDVLANTLYGGRAVCAAVARGNVVGCQFHPEKSAEAGLAVIGNFLKGIH